MNRLSSFRTTLVAAALASCASMAYAAPPVKTSGGMLTNSDGMTLYTYDKDTAGKSACNDTCATNWPPLTAEEGAAASGDYNVIQRDDGKKQWAYKGKPLYTWGKDKKPGDKTGDGVNNVWHVAKPM
jgi:predicted lipoprotein with Yx(FWY)xxD motif